MKLLLLSMYIGFWLYWDWRKQPVAAATWLGSAITYFTLWMAGALR